MAMPVKTIKEMKVFDAQGDRIGRVESVVRDPRSDKLYAIVSLGGFMGLGDLLVPLELERMVRRDDGLALPADLSVEQVKGLQAYDPEQYREVDDDQTLGQITGTSPPDQTPGEQRPGTQRPGAQRSE